MTRRCPYCLAADHTIAGCPEYGSDRADEVLAREPTTPIPDEAPDDEPC